MHERTAKTLHSKPGAVKRELLQSLQEADDLTSIVVSSGRIAVLVECRRSLTCMGRNAVSSIHAWVPYAAMGLEISAMSSPGCDEASRTSW